MPAAYAHLRFGWEVALPGRHGALPRNFPQLYNIGLQGPDPFFFYNPLFPTATGKQGYLLHNTSGQAFFTKALECYRKAPSDGARAYLFGLLGHYCLDSHCHPLIYQVTEKDQPTHVELETEFDRFLQQLDGKLPQDRSIGQYLRLTKGELATIAAFYPETAPRSLRWCLGNMLRIYQLTTSKNRRMARFLLNFGGKNGRGLIPTVGPNKNCAHLNNTLLDCYQWALDDYPALARELALALDEGTPLSDIFAPTFNK